MTGRRHGRGSNNPQLGSVAADANARRSRTAGQRQAHEARQCLARLTGDTETAVADRAGVTPETVRRWTAALRLRVDRPHASLRELGAAMNPPLTKDAYAALYRRAVRAARRVEVTVMASEPPRRESDRLRTVLLDLLRTGGAMTTATLRARIQGEFGDATREAVYRQLLALLEQGEIRNLGRRGRDVYWAHHSSPATAAAAGFGRK